jgi:hypothetical protein
VLAIAATALRRARAGVDLDLDAIQSARESRSEPRRVVSNSRSPTSREATCHGGRRHGESHKGCSSIGLYAVSARSGRVTLIDGILAHERDEVVEAFGSAKLSGNARKTVGNCDEKS